MTEIDDLKKAIELAERATEPLKKSQMELNFTPGPNPHHNPASKADRLAKKAGELTEAAVESENTGGSDAAHLHYAAGQAHTDAMHAARREGKGAVAAYHHSQADAHHRAYTRINASGTVSQIAAKGDNALPDAVEIANRRRSEAWASSAGARIPVHHRDAMTAHLRAAEAMDEISAHQDADQHRQKAAEHEQKWLAPAHKVGDKVIITKVHPGGSIGDTGIADYTVSVPGNGNEVFGHGEIHKQVWVDPAKQRREMDAAGTARQVNFMHPAFSQKGKDDRVYLHDSQTGQQLDNYEGPFHPGGDTSKTLHTWVENGERQYSAGPRAVATASSEVQSSKVEINTTELIHRAKRRLREAKTDEKKAEIEKEIRKLRQQLTQEGW